MTQESRSLKGHYHEWGVSPVTRETRHFNGHYTEWVRVSVRPVTRETRPLKGHMSLNPPGI